MGGISYYMYEFAGTDVEKKVKSGLSKAGYEDLSDFEEGYNEQLYIKECVINEVVVWYVKVYEGCFEEYFEPLIIHMKCNITQKYRSWFGSADEIEDNDDCNYGWEYEGIFDKSKKQIILETETATETAANEVVLKKKPKINKEKVCMSNIDDATFLLMCKSLGITEIVNHGVIG